MAIARERKTFDRSVDRKLRKKYKLPAFNWREAAWILILIPPILAIHLSQLLSALLYLVHKPSYQRAQTYWKGVFGHLLILFVQHCGRSDLNRVHISGTEGALEQISQKEDGTVQFSFDKRTVILGNHQIYTDWMYLWWIAYLNGSHSDVFIILKKKLKHIPILGWGMRFFSFIFLARNWQDDEAIFRRSVEKLNKPDPSAPDQLMPAFIPIFPEGTTYSTGALEKNEEFMAKRPHIQFEDYKQVLLPRPTGTNFLVKELKGLDHIYLCMIGYSEAPEQMIRQDYFTIRRMIATGETPFIHMHFHRISVTDIPKDILADEKKFAAWFNKLWLEVDAELIHLKDNGAFTANSKDSEKPPYFETSVRVHGMVPYLELASAFAVAAIGSVLSCSYLFPAIGYVARLASSSV